MQNKLAQGECISSSDGKHIELSGEHSGTMDPSQMQSKAASKKKQHWSIAIDMCEQSFDLGSVRQRNAARATSESMSVASNNAPKRISAETPGKKRGKKRPGAAVPMWEAALGAERAMSRAVRPAP